MSRNARIANSLVAAAFLALTLNARDEPKNDFRFAILGDRTGNAQPQVYGRVWREVDLLHPDFVVSVGDTIQGRDDETALDQWKAMRPIWARYQHYPLYLSLIHI